MRMRKMTAARLVAALLLAALAFGWGLRVGYTATRPWEITDFAALPADQLTWVIEGIQERIAVLTDRLAEAQQVMAGLLSVARPPPER